MTDSFRTPLGGDQINNEKLIVGYAPLADFLTSEGFRISKSSLQKFGMPSAGGVGPPREGYWGNLPAFRPSLALDWARARIRPSRGLGASPGPQTQSGEPDAADSAKGASRGALCESPPQVEPSPPLQPSGPTAASSK
jgi:hypothetical protein